LVAAQRAARCGPVGTPKGKLFGVSAKFTGGVQIAHFACGNRLCECWWWSVGGGGVVVVGFSSSVSGSPPLSKERSNFLTSA